MPALADSKTGRGGAATAAKAVAATVAEASGGNSDMPGSASDENVPPEDPITCYTDSEDEQDKAAASPDTPEAIDFDAESWGFLGPVLGKEDATGVANGELHPVTLARRGIAASPAPVLLKLWKKERPSSAFKICGTRAGPAVKTMLGAARKHRKLK